jgi:hypothetical protein
MRGRDEEERLSVSVTGGAMCTHLHFRMQRLSVLVLLLFELDP